MKLYATIGGEVSPDSIVLASTRRVSTFKSGKIVTLAMPIKSLPSTLVGGTYTLVAQAVDPTGVLTTLAIGPAVAVSGPMIALSESFAKLVLPPAVVAGSKTKVAAVIKIINTGNILSRGNTAISLYASPDGTVAGGTLIKTVLRKLAIRAGKSISVSIPLDAYPSVADGACSIVAQVIDPLSQASSETSASIVQIARAHIDLAAVALTVPASAATGKSITVALSLNNLGNIIAAGHLEIAFIGSASSNGSNPFALATLQTTIRLQPGKIQIVHLKVPVPAGVPLGTMYLTADVDPSNAFDETDLTNNVVVSGSAIKIS